MDFLHRDSGALLLVGPSGSGKSALIEHCAAEASAALVYATDDEPLEDLFESCKTSLLRRGKCVAVVDTAEGLDVQQRKSLYAAAQAKPCLIVITADSRYDGPGKTLASKCSVLQIESVAGTSLASLLMHRADLRGFAINESHIKQVTDVANGNAGMAVSTLDWALQTLAAKRRASTSQGLSNIDTFSDLVGITRTLLAPKITKPVPALGSADVGFVASMVAINAPTAVPAGDITKLAAFTDAVAVLDVALCHFIMDTDDAQALLTCTVKARLPAAHRGVRLDWPRSTANKETLLRRAAGCHGEAGLDRLNVVRLYTAQSGRMTQNNPWYHEDADVRELRKKSPFGV